MSFRQPLAVSGRQRLLDLDPQLGQLLGRERYASASAELLVATTRLPVGEWDASRLVGASPTHLGLLLVDGVLAREVLLEGEISTELLGPGDVIRPWQIDADVSLLSFSVRWNALNPVRLALMDGHTAEAMTRYPEITFAMVDRLAQRASRLTVTQAISQLTRVDRRVLALFWHLADRWGRVTLDGVVLPLAISHRQIGELIGARRPSVSGALAQLTTRNAVKRRNDGTWLLLGDAPAVPTNQIRSVIQQRRRLMP